MEKKQSKNIELEIRKASEELTEEDLERVAGGWPADDYCPKNNICQNKCSTD